MQRAERAGGVLPVVNDEQRNNRGTGRLWSSAPKAVTQEMVKGVWRGRYTICWQQRESSRGQTRRFVLLIAFSPGKSIERHSFIHLPRESWCGLISFFPSFSSPLSVEACLAQADGNTLKMPPIENDTGKNELKTRIQDLIDSNQVLVFSKSYCPYCVKVRYSFCRRGGGDLACAGRKLPSSPAKYTGSV